MLKELESKEIFKFTLNQLPTKEGLTGPALPAAPLPQSLHSKPTCSQCSLLISIPLTPTQASLPLAKIRLPRPTFISCSSCDSEEIENSGGQIHLSCLLPSFKPTQEELEYLAPEI